MASHDFDLSPLRILLLDDEPDFLLAVGSMLEVCGAQVTTSKSTREAFDLINSRLFDLLILDLQLPIVDGFALIKAIRSHVDPVVSELPAIAITAHDPKNKETSALEAGYNRFFSKPIDTDDFLSCLESYSRQAPQH